MSTIWFGVEIAVGLFIGLAVIVCVSNRIATYRNSVFYKTKQIISLNKKIKKLENIQKSKSTGNHEYTKIPDPMAWCIIMGIVLIMIWGICLSVQ